MLKKEQHLDFLDDRYPFLNNFKRVFKQSLCTFSLAVIALTTPLIISCSDDGKDEITSNSIPDSTRRKVAFFDGDFNPVDNGHLAILKEAKDTIHLDTIFLMPYGRTDFSEIDVSYSDRRYMLELALEDYGDPSFVISDLISSENVSVNPTRLFKELRAEFGPRKPLFYIIGSSILNDLDEMGYLDVINYVNIICIKSVGGELSKLNKNMKDYVQKYIVREEDPKFLEYTNDPCGHFFYIDRQATNVSIPKIKESIKEGLSNSYVKENMNPRVAKYAVEKGLYSH